MKKVFLLFILAFISINGAALAHTGLKSTNPIKDQIVKEELKEIELIFEGKVEVGSTLRIKKVGGEIVSIEETLIDENIMTGVLPKALESGNYSVNWEIIGTDGHLINGEFSFSVENKEITSKEQSSSLVKKEKEQKNVKVINQELNDNSTPSYVIPGIIGVIFLVVVVSFILLFKRKSDK